MSEGGGGLGTVPVIGPGTVDTGNAILDLFGRDSAPSNRSQDIKRAQRLINRDPNLNRASEIAGEIGVFDPSELATRLRGEGPGVLDSVIGLLRQLADDPSARTISEAVGQIFGRTGGGSDIRSSPGLPQSLAALLDPSRFNRGVPTATDFIPGTRGSPIPNPGQPPVGSGITIVDVLRTGLQLAQQLGLLPGGGDGERSSRTNTGGGAGFPPFIFTPGPGGTFPTGPGQTGGGGGGAGGGGGGGDVPFLSGEVFGGFGGFGGIGGGGDGGGLFGTGFDVGDITSIIGAIRGGGGSSRGNGGTTPIALPGGAPVNSFGGGFDLPFIDIVPQGMGGGNAAFRPTASGASAQLHQKVNPATGRLTWFKPIGRPILFSGDMATCKRVKKIASKARRSGGR